MTVKITAFIRFLAAVIRDVALSNCKKSIYHYDNVRDKEWFHKTCCVTE